MDLLLPSAASAVEEKQSQLKRAHDHKAHDCTLVEGQTVFVQNFPMGDSWIPAQIVKQAGPLSFIVKLENGRMVKRHQDHIRSRLVESQNSSSDVTGLDRDSDLDFFPPSYGSHSADPPPSRVVARSTSESAEPVPHHTRRFPFRQQKPLNRY